jgi:glutathione S-transferase
MYTLYYSPGAASMAVHWMLVELGVPFELELVDFASEAQKSPEYLAKNPSGRVPTLAIDGRTYGESTALLMILAERHPEHGLAPAPGHPGRAAYLELMVYLANNLLPAVRAFFYPQDFPGAEDEVQDNARQRIEAVFTRLDGRLADGRKFILGSDITAADFLVTVACRWSRNLPRPAKNWPHLGPYEARMKQREGLRAVHRREGLTDWINAGEVSA